MDNKVLAKKTVAELKKLAAELNITGISAKTKTQLIDLISSKEIKKPQIDDQKPIEVSKSDSTQISATLQTEEKLAPKPKLRKVVSTSSKKEEQKEEIPSITVANPESLKPTENTKPLEMPLQVQNPQNKPAENQNSQAQQNRNPNQNRNNNQNRQNPNQNRNQNFRKDNRNNNQNNQNPNQQTNRNFNNQNNSQQNNQSNNQQPSNFSQDPTIEVVGILDIVSDGTHGVLRTPKLIPSDKDTYISISQVKKLKLRKGDVIVGTARLPKENERYFSLLFIKSVNGILIDELKDRPYFEDLKPVYPDKQMKLEIGQFPISNRIIDLLAPIGFGQRAMIVAPPKAGKTTLLKDIAKGINENQPDITLIVVLIGERPEEVTDIERSVKGIVYASNFDDSPANQVAVAELSLERAKRMVESGQDVIILMDSLTRLARAYNVALPASGRTLSGGLDPVSLYPSKRFFGAARNFENGASLTIVATSLVETGSKMDDVIFEEFKGTGNMELKLDRRMANKRIFPAINLLESGTRNEELLLGTEQLQNSWKIRRMLESLGDEGNSALIDRMKTSKSNDEFMNTLHQY